MASVQYSTRPTRVPAVSMTSAAVALTLLVLPIMAVSPLWGAGLPDTGDAKLHIYRAVQLEASLLEGDLYPRWATDFVQGLGYPIFNFYAPLTYYLLIGLHWLGLTFVDAFKALHVLVFFACGLGMYLWARQLFGVYGGLLAAAAYVYAPYRFVDAYVRGDAAESLALAVLPFVMWSFHRLVHQPSLPRVVLSSLLLAAIVLTHNLTAFVLSPLLLAYVLVLVASTKAWRASPFILAALALALALSAFYWVPALGEKGLVQIERALTPPIFDYHGHFVTVQDLLSVQMPIDRRLGDIGIPKQLGASCVILALLGLIGLLRRRPERALLWQMAFLTLATVALTFLMTQGAEPLWDAVPLVAFVQFPWRLLGLTSLTLALLAGAAVRLLPLTVARTDNGLRGWLSGAGLVVLTFIVVVPSFVLLYPAERQHPVANPTVLDHLHFESTEGALGTTGGEYLPIWVDYLPEPSPMLPAYEGSAARERLNRPSLPANVQADLLQSNGRYEAYRFRADVPTTILMNVLYFPFWHAYVDGTEVPVTDFQPYGLTTLTVPAGDRLVELRREETPLGRAATWVSYFALACALVAVAAGPLMRRRWSKPVAESNVRVQAAPRYVLALGLAIIALTGLKASFIDGQTGWFRVTSAAGTAAGRQHPLSVDFGSQVTCLGYDLGGREAKPGGTLRLRLYWEAPRQLAVDYSVFVHVVSQPGLPPVAQKDSLHPANMPTSRWLPGKYIPDLHEIAVPADLAPGEYELIFGLYDPRPGGKRLSVAGREGDAAYYSLGKVVVRP